MPERFAFRQVDYRDLPTFLEDGEIRSKNHPNQQACHQTSYQNLVERRGTNEFKLPIGGVVNDCVAFYFSPLTSFTCSIHRGGVQVIPPNGSDSMTSCLEDRVFLVAKVSSLFSAGLKCCFSNYALNSKVPEPKMESNPDLIDTHINWAVFDETPLAGKIPEIGYGGSCQFFHSRATPERYQLRKPIRMAELLVQTSVPLDLLSCVVAPNEKRKTSIQQIVNETGYKIPVISKPECFIS